MLAEKEKISKKEKNLALELYDSQGKAKGQVVLNQDVFQGKVSHDLLRQAVNTYLANRRLGIACAKTRGEVSGGGRKPWRQKGTGRARVGSNRSPIWRGGGVVFGPKPRSYNKKFPVRMKVAALRSALLAKLNSKQVMLLEKVDLKTSKAKHFSKLIASLGLGETKITMVLNSVSLDLKRASSNFSKVFLCRASDLNALGVLDCQKLILTKDALEIIEKRLKKWT